MAPFMAVGVAFLFRAQAPMAVLGRAADGSLGQCFIHDEPRPDRDGKLKSGTNTIARALGYLERKS